MDSHTGSAILKCCQIAKALIVDVCQVTSAGQALLTNHKCHAHSVREREMIAVLARAVLRKRKLRRLKTSKAIASRPRR